MSLWLASYRAATSVAAPMIHLLLRRRLRRGKEHPTRYPERRGEASVARPSGALIWIHGASVGEGLSILPLIDKLRSEKPKAAILVTTGTVTSAELLAKRLPPGVIHQFIPLDRAKYVRRFLLHWKPDLALFVESEIWPNLITLTEASHCPLILINARMSEKSYETWHRLKGFSGRLMRCFSLALAQSEEDAERLRRLGLRAVVTLGNIKFAAPPLPCALDRLEQLQSVIDRRPIWLAASTHPGEEEIAAQIHQNLKSQFPNLLTLIVPRHPDRGPELERQFALKGLEVVRRSLSGLPQPHTDILLGDTLGDMGLYYRLSPMAFVGGSLVPRGGQNPLEPARLGRAVVFGPGMTNFSDIRNQMVESGAGIEVQNAKELEQLINVWLSNDQQLGEVQAKARTFADKHSAVLDHVVGAIKPYLIAMPS